MEGDADMIKWLKSRFSVPEDGTVSEKVFLSRITLNITVIIICMIAMALTAFAYFSVDISSQSNRIQAAHFDVEITVSSELDGTFVLDKNTQRSADVYVVNMKGDTVYTIEVTATGTASTGVILLREIDGDFKTPAADNLVYQNFPAIVFGFPMMLLATLAPVKPILTLIILILFFLVMNIILFRSIIFKKRK